jgi:signal transduction histidine kinase
MVTFARRVPALPPLALDLVLAAGTAVLLVVSVAVARNPSGPPPRLEAYLSAVAIAVPLLVRRRYPLGVLLACAALLFVYYTLHHTTGIAPAVPLAVALYTAAEYGHLRWALLVSLFYLAAGIFVLIGRQHQPVLRTFADFIQEGSLLAAVCLLGEAVRSRRGWAAAIRDRLAQAALVAAAEREREAERRVAQERVRIARELHDVLAHTISALGIQARVIRDGLPDGPPQVRAAAEAILSTSREAMSEVRAAVGLLRAEGEDAPLPRDPAPGISQVESLLATVRSTGLHATCDTEGTPVPLPPALHLTVYRIVQESLTNVVRHAVASRVTVTLRYLPGVVEIQVDDDGRGPSAHAGATGYGLVGIRERATALNGTALTGPGPDGGFRVLVTLPVSAGQPTVGADLADSTG